MSWLRDFLKSDMRSFLEWVGENLTWLIQEKCVVLGQVVLNVWLGWVIFLLRLLCPGR